MTAHYSATLDYLFALRNRGSSYGIDRMRGFVEALGHPERAYPVIHVAGTNGKGSVCAMLERIFRAAGYRTGLFTSPHLIHLGERVQVDRVPLGAEEIIAHVEALRPLAAALDEPGACGHPSFFEFMAAMAFRQFAQCGVDVAIIETGLGGRLDATNVVLPEISLITSVALDHTELLGETLGAIAGEKAGIIKAGRPVALGWLPPEADAVVRSVATGLQCPVYAACGAFGDPPRAPLPRTNLEGSFQQRNAAIAVLALRVLGQSFPGAEDAARAALLDVAWAGRWQRLKLADRRLLVLDASHNEEGARMLDQSLAKLCAETGRKPIIVAGVLGAARAGPLMAVVGRHAAAIYLAVPDQPRACSHAELRAALPADTCVPVHDIRVADAFPGDGSCTLGTDGDCLVVTGSIYLTGEIYGRLSSAHANNPEASLQDRI